MKLHIKSLFDCVYLINGAFFERADTITMAEYDVVYITVMPLKFTLLPYTLKLCGACNVKTELYDGIKLGDDFLLTLSPRYITVYGSGGKSAPPPPTSPIARLFSLIKSGDIDGAYAMLSEGLKSTVDKSGLQGFFAGYERIEECSWADDHRFYLIDKNSAPSLHTYTMKDEFIDNIVELDIN